MQVLYQLLLGLLAVPSLTLAQGGGGGYTTLELPASTYNYDYKLSVSDVQTTTLIFPHDIVSVDRGTPDVLTQTLEEVNNVVKVKAAFDGIDYSSLTVITDGSAVYTFRIRYDRYPNTLTYDLSKLRPPTGVPPASVAAPIPMLLGLKTRPTPRAWNVGYSPSLYLPQSTTVDSMPNVMPLEFRGTKVSRSYIQNRSEKIARASKLGGYVRSDKAKGSQLVLRDIWIEADIIYYRFTLANPSTISYDLDFWRFFVVDAKANKRTAVQERDVEILNVYSSAPADDRVEARSEAVYVVALNKFTIPDKKRLVLELFEHNGGRHHRVEVKNRHIVEARCISCKSK